MTDATINKEEMQEDLTDGITNNASNKLCFTAFSEDTVIGFFVRRGFFFLASIGAVIGESTWSRPQKLYHRHARFSLLNRGTVMGEHIPL